MWFFKVQERRFFPQAFMCNRECCTTKLATVTGLTTLCGAFRKCPWENDLLLVDEVCRPRAATPFKKPLVPFISLHGIVWGGGCLFIFLRRLVILTKAPEISRTSNTEEKPLPFQKIPGVFIQIYHLIFHCTPHLRATIKFKNLKIPPH